ncbi:hypothetical protein [Paenibacillus sp. UNC499MF]|uniref:hypothetical protein n=1 Tax=Paenibacillus sp. UNC499MF TaxID=1502751 RepID=UPI0008A022C3|nr:hypothetical protein [Paenibacillus sp. UNC499MF]SEG04894.1 hypothetical protein SAMN02799616_01669 [Paenibacillus sp. UNC499MF]
MRSFYNSETGAVSIYLIIILVPIFFLQAVLIDFARVKAAEREADTAARAAVRSVLSAFDTELQKYGLFGLTEEPESSASLFGSIYKENLSGSSNGVFYKMLDTKPEEGARSLASLYTLANHSVFKEQILEHMKYAAPIEFTLEITDKLQKPGAVKTMANGAAYAKEAEKIEKLLAKREELLDKAWAETVKMKEELGGRHLTYRARITELNRLSELIGLNTADEVRSQIKTLEEQIGSLSDSISSMNGSIAAAAASGPGAAAAIQGLMDSIRSLQDQMSILQNKLSDLKTLLENILTYTALLGATKLEIVRDDEKVQSLQRSVQELLGEAKKANDELNTELKRLSSAEGNELKAFEAFKSLKVVSEEDLRLYMTGVASSAALFSGFRSGIGSINLFTNANAQKLQAANDAYQAQMDETYRKQLDIETERNKRNENIRKEKEKQRSKIQAVLDRARQAMGECGTDQGGGSVTSFYEILEGSGKEGLYRKYMTLNESVSNAGGRPVYDLEGKPDTEIQHAMSLLERLGQTGEAIRNELFVNEYALSQFNYRTYGREMDGAGQIKPLHALSEPSGHKLPGQEVEYLLYGFNSCAKNMSSAYGEMFAFRFAVHMVEELMDPKNELLQAGSPLLVLLVSAAEAAVEALADMESLTEGKAVPVSSKLTNPLFTFTYKDYLRIFLLLHGGDTNLLARFQSLIELNTERTLDKAVTYIQGYAESSVSLWFLPGFMKLMNGTGISSCEVRENRCRFVSRAELAY